MLMSVLGSSGYLLLHTCLQHHPLHIEVFPSSHMADLHVAVFPYSLLPHPPTHPLLLTCGQSPVSTPVCHCVCLPRASPSLSAAHSVLQPQPSAWACEAGRPGSWSSGPHEHSRELSELCL